MILGDHIRLARNSLKATRGRTMLTILGIVIGVLSICLVLGFSEGARHAIKRQVGVVGENIITIRPGMLKHDSLNNIISTNFAPIVGTSTLTEYDLRTVDTSPGTDATAPLMLINGSIKNGDSQANSATIVATTPDFKNVFATKLKEGQFLEPGLSRNVVVIGRNLSIQLYGTETALGAQITLRGDLFTVIGVLDKFDTPTALTGFDFNNTAFISLDAGKSFSQGIAQIQQINVRVSDSSKIDQTAENINQKLLKNHDQEADFSVIRAEDALKQSNNLFVILTSSITAIASISLLVGGVGIMNIMLVTVAERTREIGIRKSVGATSGQILIQFLVEAVIMSLTGGMVGLVLSIAVGFIAGTFLPVAPVFTWQITVTAFVISVVVGIIFGTYPAIKAARKHPIDALKHLN